jgi:beta-lactamase class D
LWDGVRREVPAWNSDLSMNEAFRASAVWYFVEIARQNGREALGKAMREVGYGNADATGSDLFWIDGPLRISADEQVRFLARLTRGEVPFAARHRVLVGRMMMLEEGRDASGAAWALYGKTGLAPLSGGVAEASADTAIGWLVGWVERGGQKYPYALNISPKSSGTPAGPEFARARPLLVKALLRELGLLPAQ